MSKSVNTLVNQFKSLKSHVGNNKNRKYDDLDESLFKISENLDDILKLSMFQIEERLKSLKPKVEYLFWLSQNIDDDETHEKIFDFLETFNEVEISQKQPKDSSEQHLLMGHKENIDDDNEIYGALL